jgi:8-oxo-dGTP diphosphatase
MLMNESVAGIVFNPTSSEVLLIKRRDVPVWVLPGGGIEPEEDPESAVCRELLEESGLKVAIVRKVALYEPRNKLARRTHFFECKVLSGEPKISDETSDVRFFPLEKLPLMPPPYASWIADAAARHPQTLHKEIEGVNYWVFFKLLILHPILVGRFLLSRLGLHYNTNTKS